MKPRNKVTLSGSSRIRPFNWPAPPSGENLSGRSESFNGTLRDEFLNVNWLLRWPMRSGSQRLGGSITLGAGLSWLTTDKAWQNLLKSQTCAMVAWSYLPLDSNAKAGPPEPRTSNTF